MTFTISSGGNPVGSAVSAGVTGDAASATYTLPAGTAGGDYTIQAVYTDPADYTTSTGTNLLAILAASTTIAPSGASGSYSATSGEAITLSADVSSTAGTVNQGAVTFKVFDSSSNLIASTVVSVAYGVASGSYVLPAGTAVGTYTIQAAYNGTASFAPSPSEDGTLTVSGNTTTTTASNASVAYNPGGETASLTATVTSPGSTVGQGTVTFTILSGTTPIGTPITANVAAGAASTTYALPAGTPLGTYIIDAVYNATADFSGSADESHSLTVAQAPAPC